MSNPASPLGIEIQLFAGLLQQSIGVCPCLDLSSNQSFVSQSLTFRYVDAWKECFRR